MATIRRNPQGPLRNAPLIQFDSVLFWDKTRPPAVAKQDDDSNYTVKSFDRHDFVAFRELGSSQFGWVIMERQDQNQDEKGNGPMRLWPNDWVPGRRIAIPSRDGLTARGIV